MHLTLPGLPAVQFAYDPKSRLLLRRALIRHTDCNAAAGAGIENRYGHEPFSSALSSLLEHRFGGCDANSAPFTLYASLAPGELMCPAMWPRNLELARSTPRHQAA